MYGVIKFHKATGPAFNAGEVWVSGSGNRVTILGVEKYPGTRGDYNSDYSVLYEWVEGGVVRQHEKDAWNFQVRYTHIADLKVR